MPDNRSKESQDHVRLSLCFTPGQGDGCEEHPNALRGNKSRSIAGIIFNLSVILLKQSCNKCPSPLRVNFKSHAGSQNLKGIPKSSSFRQILLSIWNFHQEFLTRKIFR